MVDDALYLRAFLQRLMRRMPDLTCSVPLDVENVHCQRLSRAGGCDQHARAAPVRIEQGAGQRDLPNLPAVNTCNFADSRDYRGKLHRRRSVERSTIGGLNAGLGGIGHATPLV